MKIQNNQKPNVSFPNTVNSSGVSHQKTVSPENLPAIKGEITELIRDEVTVKLENGQQITGKLVNPEGAKLGMEAEFSLTKSDGGGVLLEMKSHEAPADLDARLSEALKSFGFKADADNIGMVKKLIQNDFPVTKDIFQKLNQAVKLMGKENADKALFFLENEINISLKNADRLNGYANQEIKIDKQINDLIKNVINMDNKEIKKAAEDIITERDTKDREVQNRENVLEKELEVLISSMSKNGKKDMPLRELIRESATETEGLRKLIESNNLPEFRALRNLIHNQDLTLDGLKELLNKNAPEIRELKKYLETDAPVIRELKKIIETAPEITQAEKPDKQIKELIQTGAPETEGLRKLIESSNLPEFRALRNLIHNKDLTLDGLKELLNKNAPEIRELKKYLEDDAPVIRELKKYLEADAPVIRELKKIIETAPEARQAERQGTPIKELIQSGESAFSGLKKLLDANAPEFSGLKFMIERSDITPGDLNRLISSNAPVVNELKKYMDMDSPNTRELARLLDSINMPGERRQLNQEIQTDALVKNSEDTKQDTKPIQNGYEALKESIKKDVFERLDILLKRRDVDMTAFELFSKEPAFREKVTEMLDIKFGKAKQLAEKLSFDAQDKTVKDLDEFINGLSAKMSSLKKISEGDSSLSKHIDDIKENISFMSEMKHNVFMQIPFAFADNKTTGELYVFKDKRSKRKKGDEAQSALISLDLVELGHFEAYIEKVKRSVQCQFRIDNEKTEKIIKQNIRSLVKKLSEYEYSLDYYCFKEITEPFSVTDRKPDMEGEAVSEDKKYVFDMRT